MSEEEDDLLADDDSAVAASEKRRKTPKAEALEDHVPSPRAASPSAKEDFFGDHVAVLGAAKSSAKNPSKKKTTAKEEEWDDSVHDLDYLFGLESTKSAPKSKKSAPKSEKPKTGTLLPTESDDEREVVPAVIPIRAGRARGPPLCSIFEYHCFCDEYPHLRYIFRQCNPRRLHTVAIQ